jgi:hypothetical protein
MSAEMIIGSVLAAIILLRWLKWLRGDGENAPSRTSADG